MTSPVHHVTFDCLDPYALAGFWADALGGRRQDDDGPGDEEVLVAYPGGTPLLFIRVPDAKSVKNRVHLDLMPTLSRAEEVTRLRELGASVLDDRTRPDGTGWVVMADPEGNEFCVERSATERGMAPVDTGERPMPADGNRTADERTLLTGMLEWYRQGVLRKVAGMSRDDAAASPVRSGTSVAGIVKHLALVEDAWFTNRIGQRPMPEPWTGIDFDEDPEWEFRTARSEPLADSVALYEQACARSHAIVASLDLDATATNERGRVFSVRWVLLHMIEETARHLGHLDLLRELADGTTGE